MIVDYGSIGRAFRLANKQDIDTRTMLFLVDVAARPGSSYAAIAERMGVQPPVVSRCKRRAPAAWVDERAVDGRMAAVSLTPAGRAALDGLFEEEI